VLITIFIKTIVLIELCRGYQQIRVFEILIKIREFYTFTMIKLLVSTCLL